MLKKLQHVYSCEHCGRKMISAGAMGYHEKWCAKNPKNFHPCTADYCAHLVKEGQKGDMQFYCGAQKNKPMYSYKLLRAAQRGGSKYREESILSGKELMPSKCDLYQNEFQKAFPDGL